MGQRGGQPKHRYVGLLPAVSFRSGHVTNAISLRVRLR